MRKFTLGIIIAAFGAFTAIPTASAAPVGPGLTDRLAKVETPLHKTGYDDRCAYLRYKCSHKEQLDEVGEGNCRRYHRECGGLSYCERLRRACIYKEERGEVGQGNCRRYHDECGGRGRRW
jgi:hypothetical protein